MPIAFELSLTTTDSAHLTVKLSVTRETATINVYDSNNTYVLRETIIHQHVLQQRNDGEIFFYWLSLDWNNHCVKYGTGEIRDKCTVLRCDLPDHLKEMIRKISKLEIRLEGEEDIQRLVNFQHKFRCNIGKYPVVNDPALFIISGNEYNLAQHFIENTGLRHDELPLTCQK
jgi:hypothetical protein